MPSKKSQKTRRTTRSGAQGTKRPTSSATPNPKRPRRTASTQVEEDQSQPRQLTTDDIPTIVNAVLQARQTQPPVTGDNGNPGNDSSLRRDDDETVGGTSDDPVTDIANGLQASTCQTLPEAGYKDAADFGEFIIG